MRQDVKELADAMERGWKLVPKTCYAFFVFNDKNKITSCCAMGHALLGNGFTPQPGNHYGFDMEKLVKEMFPILDYQKVEASKERLYNYGKFNTLESIINQLILRDWNTLQVIEWLRFHQND